MASNFYKSPPFQLPSISKIKEIAARFGMDELTDNELRDYQEHFKGTVSLYSNLLKFPEPKLPVKYPRTPGHRPSEAENQYNAWAVKTDIHGAPDGLLKGKKVAIKDNIPVAGVPLMNGSPTMEGYIPEFDATVVSRILDAGGHIAGKAVCEDLCSSGSSFTCAIAPVLNPWDPTRSAGGSSSGSAVLVASGEVDMALGGDQGGSIRLPACWCGIVGLKPTWSLVPYTGIASLEHSIDHVGPMARTVKDCALLLEAIAGYDDGLDARQRRDYVPPKYSELLTGDLKGMKVGVLDEGFANCCPDVESTVREAAKSLSSAGATVSSVSIPMHLDGCSVWLPICIEGAYNNAFRMGNGSGSKGFYPTSLMRATRKGIESQANDLSVCVKEVLIIGEYIRENHGMEFYARAQNVNRLLVAAYDEALKTHDVIIMPTIKYTAPQLPKEDASVSDKLHNASDMVQNTGPFDATGHPALSINAGTSNGLPVGMMIVGKHFDDATVLNVAYAFEKIRDDKVNA